MGGFQRDRELISFFTKFGTKVCIGCTTDLVDSLLFWFKRILPNFCHELYSKVVGFDAPVSELPDGALLDYRSQVDKLRDKTKKEVDAHIQHVGKIQHSCSDLMGKMRKILAEQKSIFAEAGIKIEAPGKNPVAEALRGKLTGVDELATRAREIEMDIHDLLGLTPKEGWTQAILTAAQKKQRGNTMNELSSLLADRNDEKNTTEKIDISNKSKNDSHLKQENMKQQRRRSNAQRFKI